MTHERIIDLRSDTVTRPTDAMRRAMAEAEVGDDVFGEDPTVVRLQERVAGLLGKEAAMFVPSGSMGNQIAIHVHTRPGDEVVVEGGAHSHDYELGGMAALSGVQPRAVQGDAGVMYPDQVAPLLEPRPYFRSATGLVILENTHNMSGGRVFPLEVARAVCAVCRDAGVPIHQDGARLWHAAVATSTALADLVAPFDSVMVCLSKGLSAPIGSLVAGESDFIVEARRARKLFGGAMHQVGVVAAAGLVAIDTMRDRLAEDHARAARLAAALEAVGAPPATGGVDTNILVVDVSGGGIDAAGFCEAMAEHGVLCLPTGPDTVRFVTHRHIGDDDIERTLVAARSVLGGATSG